MQSIKTLNDTQRINLMEYTDDLSDFMTFVGTISILVYSVHCPVEA